MNSAGSQAVTLRVVYVFLWGMGACHLFCRYPLRKESLSFFLPVVFFLTTLIGTGPVSGQQDAQALTPTRVLIEPTNLEMPVLSVIKDHEQYLWVGTNNGLYRFDGYSFDQMDYTTPGGNTLINRPVYAIFEDEGGNLWIGCENELFVLTKGRQKLLSYQLPSNTLLLSSHINDFLEMDGIVWIAALSQWVFQFKLDQTDPDSITLRRAIPMAWGKAEFLFPVDQNRIGVKSGQLDVFLIDSTGATIERIISENIVQNIVLSEALGLVQNTPRTLEVLDATNNRTKLLGNLPLNEITTPSFWLAPYQKGEDPGVWIGATNGLLWNYHHPSGLFYDYTPLMQRKFYLERYQSFTTGFDDGQGSLWLGTTKDLVQIYTPPANHFQILPRELGVVNKAGNYSARGILEMRDGSILVGGYYGLFRFSPDLKEWKEYTLWSEERKIGVNPVAYAFQEDGDHIWIATEGNGILRYGYAEDSISRIVSLEEYAGFAIDKKITLWSMDLMKDSQGRTWVGTGNGLFYLDEHGAPKRDTTIANQELIASRILDIQEDQGGDLWIGTDAGLFYIDRKSGVIERKIISGQSRVAINAILINQDGSLWLGTKGEGLKLYFPDRDSVHTYSEVNGLADDIVCAIQRAGDGSFWISTENGLSCFTPETQSFRNFYMEDGLPDNEFNHSSFYQDSKGLMYFGGVNGVIRFDPAGGVFPGDKTGLRITKLVWHDGKEGSNRERIFNVGSDPALNLTYRDKYFSVYYSTDDPSLVAQPSYVYKLDGLHDSWQLNGRSNFVQITGLSPGNYELHIKTLGSVSEELIPILRIPIHITQAFYKTWAAFLVYTLLLGLIAYSIFSIVFQRMHMRNRLQLEKEHSHRLEEINKAKSAFFTNITHEFKTPLTLIQGPAEEISLKTDDPSIKKHAGVISKHANSILSLVNQLLELNKLEANLDKPQFHRRDILPYLRQWIDKFALPAERKNVRLRLESEANSIYLDFDPVKMEKVVTNLLSNAMKFTPEGGSVTCDVHLDKNDPEGKDLFVLSISDSGPGISVEERDQIFDRFYQGKLSVHGGTGVGLAFVRELVRLHHGSVMLDLDYTDGARFIVKMPVIQEESVITEQTGEESPDTLSSNWVATTPAYARTQTNGRKEEMIPVLLAEDHEHVANLIRDVLSDGFRVDWAPNGKIAFEKAVDHIPDLVITDVMMPVMDGYSLTHMLKNDRLTSHIPIIMLTAKDSLESRIQGRKHGADVYLNKPFSTTELKYTVRNLLTTQRNAILRASNAIDEEAWQFNPGNDRDREFYTEFLHLVEERISDSTLSVQDFLVALGMSRTQLHRKVKGITGQSVNQLVRNIRLQKGLSLLKSSGMNISEVAYEVGFTSPSYFGKSFREYFGYTPAEAGRKSE